METFKLSTEYIELIKLLKILRWVGSGGEAKVMVENGEVLRNGELEYRKRAKLIIGDVIEFNGKTATIIA